MTITADDLREILDYDPLSGGFTWRVSVGGVMRGSRAGCHDGQGYIHIAIRRRKYKAHRLAWLHVHGGWPPYQIDHINGHRDDNRLSNLRLATGSQNNWNAKRRRDNTSGVKGVSWDARSGNWQAQIMINGKGKHLGFFSTKEQAASARLFAERKFHGEYART